MHRLRVGYLALAVGLVGLVGLTLLVPQRPLMGDDANASKTNSRLPPPAQGWPQPKLLLFLTGRQHGYLEPCGCTGLANAKGGMSRRDSLLSDIRDRGWDVAALDVGNQVRRSGPQPEIKFQTTIRLLKKLNYDAIAFGPDDLKLSTAELAFAVGESTENNPFICSNVDLFGLNGKSKVIERGGMRIGITAALGSTSAKAINNSELEMSDPEPAIEAELAKLKAASCQLLVLLAHTDLEETRQWATRFPDFHVILTAGGAGEPTLEPERVEGSQAQIVQVGTKGMYVGLLGFYPGQSPAVRYERIELDDRFPDSPRVMESFSLYQQQLQDMGFDGLGLQPSPHPLGKDRKFVGHEVCGECHTQALDVFLETPHLHATDSIAHPTERSDIPRHFDPECLSCHVTGWNAQQYFPYESGYVDLAKSEALHGNGCENCHGPGSVHAAAETGDLEVNEEQLEKLRASMRLTVEQARKTKCYECHDLDNSPEFDFDTYWEQVKHEGVD